MPFHLSRINPCFIRFDDGSRSPYTLAHLSADGRFLLTWGPQRGLQLLDLERRAVAFTVPAEQTGVLEAVICGAQAPADAAAAGTNPSCSVRRADVRSRLTPPCRSSAFFNRDTQQWRPRVAVALVIYGQYVVNLRHTHKY